MREMELKRRERLRLGWAVSLTVLATLLSAVGSAKAGSKTTKADIKRAVELRVGIRKCDQAFVEIHRAEPSMSHAGLAKACASLLPEGPCRSAFVRGEKVLALCLDTYCAALTRNEPVEGCSDKKKVVTDTPAVLADKKLCKRRARVKKHSVVEALWERRMVADLARFVPQPKAEQLASRMLTFLPRHAQKKMKSQSGGTRINNSNERPLRLYIDNSDRKHVVSTGSRHWTFAGQPTSRAVDAMVKALKETSDKKGGASRVELHADSKVTHKFVTSIIDGLRSAGFKDFVIATAK